MLSFVMDAVASSISLVNSYEVYSLIVIIIVVAALYLARERCQEIRENYDEIVANENNKHPTKFSLQAKRHIDTCPVIIDYKMYDLADYLNQNEHPGGKGIVEQFYKQDCSKLFHSMHQDSRQILKDILPQYLITQPMITTTNDKNNNSKEKNKKENEKSEEKTENPTSHTRAVSEILQENKKGYLSKPEYYFKQQTMSTRKSQIKLDKWIEIFEKWVKQLDFPCVCGKASVYTNQCKYIMIDNKKGSTIDDLACLFVEYLLEQQVKWNLKPRKFFSSFVVFLDKDCDEFKFKDNKEYEKFITEKMFSKLKQFEKEATEAMKALKSKNKKEKNKEKEKEKENKNDDGKEEEKNIEKKENEKKDEKNGKTKQEKKRRVGNPPLPPKEKIDFKYKNANVGHVETDRKKFPTYRATFRYFGRLFFIAPMSEFAKGRLISRRFECPTIVFNSVQEFDFMEEEFYLLHRIIIQRQKIYNKNRGVV